MISSAPSTNLSWSVSSIRSIKSPPSCFAIRYAYNAVRRLPTCILPVGLGANLVLTLLMVFLLIFKTGVCGFHPIPHYHENYTRTITYFQVLFPENSFIISLTSSILLHFHAFSPQNKSACSVSPNAACTNASVMQ